MKTLKQIPFLLFIVLLAGCSTPLKYIDRNIKPAEFAQNNKAIVIMKVFNAEETLLSIKQTHCPYPNCLPGHIYFSIARVDEDYYSKQPHLYLSEKVNKTNFPAVDLTDYTKDEPYEMFMIDPGTYVIEKLITYSPSNSARYIRYAGRGVVASQKDQKDVLFAVWGYFTVKAGEVVYLGDIYYQMSKYYNQTDCIRQPKGTIVNRYANAIKEFKANYPALASYPIQNRPLWRGVIELSKIRTMSSVKKAS